ncbi:peptidyl-prolyl cis-trans isomerase fkbp17-1, partial [Quercus suber]
MVMMMFQLRPHIRILQYQYYHPSTTPKSAYNINNISKCRRREAAALSVAIHYYGRLAAKQGWRFDSTYDHKDENGESVPFVFVLGSGKVISGIEAAVKSMKVGCIRRVIIPPSQDTRTHHKNPYHPMQRLFTTIFNPTRLANGEGSTLGTLIFDIEL